MQYGDALPCGSPSAPVHDERRSQRLRELTIFAPVAELAHREPQRSGNNNDASGDSERGGHNARSMPWALLTLPVITVRSSGEIGKVNRGLWRQANGERSSAPAELSFVSV